MHARTGMNFIHWLVGPPPAQSQCWSKSMTLAACSGLQRMQPAACETRCSGAPPGACQHPVAQLTGSGVAPCERHTHEGSSKADDTMPTVPAPGEERWSRGCSILGLSNAVTQYREPGVLIHNFQEDRAGLELAASGKHHLGFGAPFNATSTQRRSYQPLAPEELAEGSQRHDKRLETKGVGGDLLMRHGDFSAPPETFYATLNQLTLPEQRQHGEPRVGTYVWSDSNKHNRTVPLNTGTLGLTARKQQQWEAEGNAGPFHTTTRDGLLSAALHSAAHPHKQGTIKLAAEPGAHLPMVGRKPVGPHAAECEKTYRRTGLRDVYVRGNVA